MRRRAWSWLLIPALALAAQGCVPAYRPPNFDEPHAILKFRRTYTASSGRELAESLLVNSHQAYLHTSPAEASQTAHTDAILVHPQPAQLEASAEFFHHESRLVHETYQQQVPYSTFESYSCGTSRSFRTCTRSVTRYRSETRSRLVTRTVRVVDAACAQRRALMPARDASYVLELNFQGHGLCHLSCFEQRHQPDGSFTNLRCPAEPR